MVKDLHTLPQMIVVPRLDGEGSAEYALEFSGLPHQCGRCRSHDHQVRNCPRKDPPRTRDSKQIPAPTSPRSNPTQVPPDPAKEQFVSLNEQNLNTEAAQDTTPTAEQDIVLTQQTVSD